MQEQKNSHLSDHLANERTYLAWIRTAIGIMAFGFVVVKFSLFVKELSLALGNRVPQLPLKGLSSISGIGLVAMGAVLSISAYARFKRTEKQINQQDFRQESWLMTVFTALIFVMGMFLIAYLFVSI